MSENNDYDFSVILFVLLFLIMFREFVFTPPENKRLKTKLVKEKKKHSVFCHKK